MSQLCRPRMVLLCFALQTSLACGRLNFDPKPASDDDAGLIDASGPGDAPAEVTSGVDLSFGASGFVIVDEGGIDNLGYNTHGIAVQPNGSILISGKGGLPDDSNALVLRLLEDGTIDSSFGTAGKTLISYGLNSVAQGLALQGDGRIVLAISADKVASNPSSALARLESDGSLDMSFGMLGLRIVDFPNGSDSANGVLVAPGGKVTFGGQTCCAADGWDLVNARLDASGDLDPSFGTGGMVVSDISNGDEFGSPVAVLADGSVYAMGSTYVGGPNRFDFAVLRLDPAGVLDPTFGTAGTVATDFDGRVDRAGDLVVYPDGRILVVGHSGEGAEPGDAALARYDAEGGLDTSFGISGQLRIDLGGNDVLHAALRMPDGRIVAAGSTDRGGSTNFLVLVLLDDGSPDTSVGPDGVMELDVVPGQDDVAWGLALDGAGRVLVFGETDDGTQGDLALVRLRF